MSQPIYFPVLSAVLLPHCFSLFLFFFLRVHSPIFARFCFYLLASLNPSSCRRCCRGASQSCCSPQTAAMDLNLEEWKEVLLDEPDCAHSPTPTHVQYICSRCQCMEFFFFFACTDWKFFMLLDKSCICIQSLQKHHYKWFTFLACMLESNNKWRVDTSVAASSCTDALLLHCQLSL